MPSAYAKASVTAAARITGFIPNPLTGHHQATLRSRRPAQQIGMMQVLEHPPRDDEDDGSDHQADEPECRSTTEQAEEDDEPADRRLAGEQEWPEDVVGHADAEHADGQQKQ